jgi:hypothetical protein
MSRAITHAAAASLALALSLTAPMTASAADAMRVVRDPATGELRGPTAAEMEAFEKAEAQLRAGSRRSVLPQQPTEVQHPDGSVEMKLGEDTMMYSVVSSAADGTLRFDCLPAKQAQQFVKGQKPATSKTAAKVSHEHK